ncbi:alpha-galactosidase [Microbacterium sp. HM58-2]|nr:alpha-galactosidase [Microbacterium sp. HM58-2]
MHSADGDSVVVTAQDDATALILTIEIEMSATGLIRIRHRLTNQGEAPYELERLSACLPVADSAAEILDLTGRHALERVPVRVPFEAGTRLRESRHGRPGADAAFVTVTGEAGFSFRRGQVWGVHLGWSGNQRSWAECLPTGERMLGSGELLLPGEVRLAAGGAYQTPWMYAAYGEAGMDSMSARFHSHARALSHIAERARPITFNSWEAMSFDMDERRLLELAERAASVGVERFVIDDGWFGGRRDDRSSLGDWVVSPDLFPRGLGDVARRTHELGMELGIWFEPEMINLDSDLARAHPDWLLRLPDRIPVSIRHQQVLDLTNQDAWEWIFEAMSAIIADLGVGYVKWDHNRDLIDAGRGESRVPAVHEQTLAFYALLDALRSRFPDLAIESCASGGARIDLGVLERCDRFWASDTVDPLDRQLIQQWTALVMPPEILGAHVGATVAGSTRRRHRLNFRAGTALLGDFGIEWDLTEASEAELRELRQWVDLYRRHRRLLREGTVVRGDMPPALALSGRVSPDTTEALYVLASLDSNPEYSTGRLRLEGLDPESVYRVVVEPPAQGESDYLLRPEWIESGGIQMTGRALALIGVEGPTLWPEEVAVIHCERIGPATETP